MYMKKTLLTLLSNLLVLSAWAQASVTVGDQVTSEDDLVSGSAYIVQYVGNGNSGYMKDTGSAYTGKSDNDATESAVYYFTSNGDGTWQVKNYYTGNYWGTPTASANTYIGSATAGAWSLNFQSGNNIAPSCNGYSWNRSDSNIHPWSEGTASANQMRIYAIEKSLTAFSDFDGYDISVSSEAASTLSTGQWYVMFDRGANHGYLYENTSSHTLYNTSTVPAGAATTAAKYLVRLTDAGSGMYYLQTGLGNYFGALSQSTAVPTTAIKSERITVGTIASTAGHFYLQSESTGIVLDANATTAGDATVVGWGSSVPTSTGGNNDWAFYLVNFTESWAPLLTEIYTINNTNSNRGALIYNPDASAKWVWSSGKSGSFDATNANSQWIICPTTNAREYYLYNVGAQKFAVPTTGGTYSGVCWKFSNDAAPVKLDSQSDGTYKIRAPYGDRYMAVSNGYEGPIINYNDVGGNFTITKVDDTDAEAQAQVNAALGRLIDNVTALTSTSGLTDGWYVIHINSGDWTGHSLRSEEEEINYSGTDYAVGFYGWGYEHASIATGEHLFHITPSGSGYTWQLPNGRYLCNESNKFPVSTADASVVSIDKQTAGFRFYQNNRYATPYLLSSQYFIGETSASKPIFDIYPASLSDAGLVAWQVVGTEVPESAKLTCTRSDVSGLASVYVGGYFFLPSGITPTSSDFSMTNMIGCTVSSTAHTVTVEYDPRLAIVAEGVTVSQGYQTTGRGNSKAVLLRMEATNFLDMSNAVLNVSLADGTADNVSSLTLYETGNTVEFMAQSSPTQVATASVTGNTVQLNLGTVSASTHYYWLCATVNDDAELDAILDASLVSLTYDANGYTGTTCDLSEVGNPSDRGLRVMDVQQYVFLPTTYNSNVYRIPALTVAADGSLVAAADKRYNRSDDIGSSHVIDIVVRRSTDGGKTWSTPVTVAKGDSSNDATCGYGDPSLTVGKDGRIYCLFAAGNTGYFYGLNRIAMSTSDDNGQTWTSPVDLYETGRISDETELGLYDYFVTSGKGLYTSDGVLMYLLPAQPYTASDKSTHQSNSNDYVFYSTDDGATWHISPDVVFSGGDEAKIEQAGEGSLIASVRQGYNRGFNFGTYVKNSDGTVTFTWSGQYNNSQLNAGGSANNQDILYYSHSADGDADIVLHTMTTDSGHANLNVYMSIDGAENWTRVTQIQPGGARYATMTKLANGDLGILFEDYSLGAGNQYPINFITLTKEQILAWYDELAYAAAHPDVKIAYGLTGDNSYGSWSGSVWTSNTSSGKAGMTMTLSDGTVNRFSNWNSRYNMAYKATTEGADVTLTLTAPEGYVIVGYTLDARNHTDGTTVVTAADGTTVTSATSDYTTLAVNGLNTESTVITLNCSTTANWFTLSNFVVSLQARSQLLGDVDNSGEVDDHDVTALVNYLLGALTDDDINLEVADVNGDGHIGVGDVTALVTQLRIEN